MSSSHRVVHHPRRHPFVDRPSSPDDDHLDAVDVWDVDALVASDVHTVHLHVDFDHIAPDDMWAWCAALRRAGIHLAYTVHHIDNPLLVDQQAQRHPAARRLEGRGVVPVVDAGLDREMLVAVRTAHKWPPKADRVK